MKKILLSTMIIIPSMLLSYDLEFSKSFNKDIQNDKIHTNVSIIVDSKEVDFINEKIEFFQDFIEENNSVTKMNGNYSLVPNYSYPDNKRTFIGYRGSLNYSIETPKYEKLNQFIGELNNIKNNMNTSTTKLSVSNLQWIVSKELYEKNIDLMRIESIKWIKEYTKSLSDNCVVKNISIHSNDGYSTPRYTKNVMLESATARNVTPSQTKKSITLSANYKLECK